ncbi:hypothetical protein FQR65_LT10947 [Abscondita terminalis]|nr:hypothetical protein FQR65_LT10947 [Abscondita terminalis]
MRDNKVYIMGEETKFIIAQINKLLNKDLNLSSFESLSHEDLLLLVCDVLAQLEVTIASDYNADNAAVVILEALQNIKYSPPDGTDPETITNGISSGNKAIVKTVLHWLLYKQEQVKKRAYLSKYVEKLECPPEILDDSFGKFYKENIKEEKQAAEAEELQHDIAKMEEDSFRLQQRIQQQSQKIENIPNKEALIATVRAYRNEVNEQNKLEQQILEQQNLEVQMENEMKELKEILGHKKARRGNKVELVQLISDELNTNNIIKKQLLQELQNVKEEMELCDALVKRPEPMENDLIELNNELSKLNEEIQNLIENKVSDSEDNSDGQLTAFKNQATIIANKKQEVSKPVMDLKTKMQSIEEEISEKEELLKTLIGGPLLQGDNLKKYVSKLREHNILYKEYKSQLSALTTEVGILNRTIDVLKSLDVSIDEVLKKEHGRGLDNQSKELSNDIDELREEFKRISDESDQVRAETAQLREELKAKNTDIEPLIIEYNQTKEAFEEITESSSMKLEQINSEIAMLEDDIKSEEEKWKYIQQENRRKEELLVKISEDMINNADVLNKEPTQVKTMKEKLEQQIKVKNSLLQELHVLEAQKVENQEKLIHLDHIIMLLQAKMKCSNRVSSATL